MKEFTALTYLTYFNIFLTCENWQLGAQLAFVVELKLSLLTRWYVIRVFVLSGTHIFQFFRLVCLAVFLIQSSVSTREPLKNLFVIGSTKTKQKNK